jgi:putative sterol carrier protein
VSDTRERFFKEVGRQRHVRLLERTSGTVLVEIEGGARPERWYVVIRRGDVSVSRSGTSPDCTIRTDGETFDEIIAGKMSTLPAVLRNRLELEGKVNLALALQAFFKPSTGAAGEQVAGYARRPK